jgi:DNA-binding XRE family transcriptional regulator
MPRWSHDQACDKYLVLLIYHGRSQLAVKRGRKSRAESRYLDQSSRLADKLREARQGAGMSQQQLAGAAEVAVSTVRKIESGAVVEPGYFTVLALTRALGLGIDEIAP